MKTKSNWVKVGEFGVDAGLCWIGDPCYILHKEKLPAELGKNWGDFCDILYEKEESPTMVEFQNGICVATGYGDGSYPVEAKIVDGRVKEVRIKFF